MTRTDASRWTQLAVAALLTCGCATHRADAAEAERIAHVLGVRPGMSVADVGAGDGDWSVELARQVGEEGHVYATEVDSELIAELEDTLLGTFLDNHTVLRGSQDASGLGAGCCDAILVRMVYHHFQRPGAMRRDLWRALSNRDASTI